MPVASAKHTCAACGYVDEGNFCSNCGQPLVPAVAEEGIAATVVRQEVVRQWPRYFRTIRAVVLDRSRFFAGAFSDHAAAFHAQTGTLSAGRFFVTHSLAIGLLVVVGDRLLGVDENTSVLGLLEPSKLAGDVSRVLLGLVWLYAFGAPLMVFLRGRAKNAARKRPAVGAPVEPTVSANRVMRAVVYASAADLLSIPLLVVLDAVLGNGHVDSTFLWVATILAGVGKFVSQFWLLPEALSFSCRVSKSVAGGAVSFTYACIFGLTQAMKMVARV
jgi:hypothetical protein